MKNKWILYAAIGFEIGISVIAGLLIGSYVDEWIGTKNPYFTFLGLMGGAATGLTLLIKMLRIRDDRK